MKIVHGYVFGSLKRRVYGWKCRDHESELGLVTYITGAIYQYMEQKCVECSTIELVVKVLLV